MKATQREKQIYISIFVILSILCAGLKLSIECQPRPGSFVENRKASLYDISRVPQSRGQGNLNINTATKEMLCTLPGIGETLADRIIAHREEYGPFPHPMAIIEVRGIGEKLYEKLSPLICTT